MLFVNCYYAAMLQMLQGVFQLLLRQTFIKSAKIGLQEKIEKAS